MEGGSGDDTVRLTRAGLTRSAAQAAAPTTSLSDVPGSPAHGSGRGELPPHRGGAVLAGLLALLILVTLGATVLWWEGIGPRRDHSTASIASPDAVPPPGIAPPPTAGLPRLPADPPRGEAAPAAPLIVLPDPFVVPPAPPAEATRPPRADPPLLSEPELVALLPAEPRVLRLRENPRVFVLLFPTLGEQGAALNRMAALIEKAGLPRDRLLDDDALARAIREQGEAAATWYLGHDYNGTDLARFFALAERDRIALSPAELWVRDRFHEARALVAAGDEVALISTANPDHRMDHAMRAAILRHEIGHGHFFTLPALRAHVLRVWRERFQERDRQAFRTFLAREGYDESNETLMANEAMAYLVFTPDPRFFSARHVGRTEAEVARLREMMRSGMPLP